jgi:CheY-like chemotaxis protein
MNLQKEVTQNNVARILVVEDEAIVAADLEDRLGRMGYDVVGTAESGEEAIQKTRELKPDLVFMDIMLKGAMDGIEAAALMREEQSIPVIFLTANSNDAIINRAKVSEPFAYLLKPFEERHLKINVEMSLYKHRMELERELLILELQEALSKVKTLTGLLPICAWCKNIRDDEGYWLSVEKYIQQNSDAKLSHGVCPDCARKHFSEFMQE